MSRRCVGCQVSQGRECACMEAQLAADEARGWLVLGIVGAVGLVCSVVALLLPVIVGMR